MNIVFVLGSHVRHVGVIARLPHRPLQWVPLCGQRRPSNDLNGLDWTVASTPAQNSRSVCSHCIREVERLIDAVIVPRWRELER